MAQQREREPDVGADDPLEVLERRVGGGQLPERLQRRERARAGPVAAAARAGEERALEVAEAEHAAARELVRVVDVGGDERRGRAARARRSAPAAPRRCGPSARTLTVAQSVEQRRRAGVAVEREREAGLPELLRALERASRW